MDLGLLFNVHVALSLQSILIGILLIAVSRLSGRVRTLENLPSIKDHLKYAKKNKK